MAHVTKIPNLRKIRFTLKRNLRGTECGFSLGLLRVKHLAKSNKPTLKPMKPHSRATPFQNKYFLEYGLQVVTHGVNTHEIQSVECQFCAYFSQTPSIPDTRQRKLTSRIKSWTAPWRAELFSKHHKRQHPSKWTEYQSTSFDDKGTFFNSKEKFKDTIYNAFGNGEDSCI